jgi:hypothetical protein
LPSHGHAPFATRLHRASMMSDRVPSCSRTACGSAPS